MADKLRKLASLKRKSNKKEDAAAEISSHSSFKSDEDPFGIEDVSDSEISSGE